MFHEWCLCRVFVIVCSLVVPVSRRKWGQLKWMGSSSLRLMEWVVHARFGTFCLVAGTSEIGVCIIQKLEVCLRISCRDV